jgi:FKBP-type peptidyl-prolyl cis-trans isomerase (trigger factor)
LPIQRVTEQVRDDMSQTQKDLIAQRNRDQTETNLRRYVTDVANSLVDRNLAIAGDELLSRLARLNPETPDYQAVQQQLSDIHRRRAQLKGE